METQLKPWKSYANWMLGILIINVFLCFVFIGLFLLILIGAWQFIDALVYFYRGDRRRKWYLILATLYLPFLSFISSIDSMDRIVLMAMLFVIPYLIAFWYWSIVHQHANEVSETAEAGDDDLERHLIG